MIPLRTERLRLRPFRAEDAEALLAIHQHEGLRRFVSRQVLESVADVPDRLERFGRFDDHPTYGIVAAERLSDGAVVGLIMLQPIPASEGVELDDVEIGWRGHPELGGHGYMTEAARAVLDHALTTSPRVVAVTDPDNYASQAICRRIGMRDEGTTDDYYDEPGIRLFVADRPAVTLDEDGAVRQEGEPGGRVTLGPVTDGDALIWYEIDKASRGRGYATQAVGEAIRRAAEGGVRRVVAEVALTNPASRTVLERNGFHQVETEGPIAVGEGDEPAARYVREIDSR